MREFISSTTSEELISDTLGREPVDDIRALIDIGNIPHLLRRLWDDVFDELFDYPDAMDIRSAAGVIRDGRNRSWGHPGVGDFDIDFTRVYLFLIADVLKEIDKLDAKREVAEGLIRRIVKKSGTNFFLIRLKSSQWKQGKLPRIRNVLQLCQAS